MLDMLVSGKTFSINKYVMSDDIDDIKNPRYHVRRRIFFQPVDGLSTWVCMHLDGSTWSESLPSQTCYLESPEHVPRTTDGAHTWVRGPGRLSACHGVESTRKGPRPEEKKMPMAENHICIYARIHR